MFLRRNKWTRSRFNLLLLTEGEYYFSDYSVVYFAADSENHKEIIKRKVNGRLKVCSKSLLFEPQDVALPIVKYEFKDIIAIGEGPNSEEFFIKTLSVIEMKENNIVAPYKFIQFSQSKTHRFSIKYTPLSSFLTHVNRLYRISKLDPDKAESRLRELIEEREAVVQFDLSWLETLSEKPLLEITCLLISPLVMNPGRLMITDKMLYFQPFNNVDPNPVDKYPLKDICRVIKRRHTLRPVGLEIYFEPTNSIAISSSNKETVTSSSVYYKPDVKSVFFAFKTQKQRDDVFSLLTTRPGMPKLQHENQAQMTFKWQCGIISNCEYLLYLNSLADRTFNDITQYPVFPWVIADYTSPTLDLNNPRTFRDLSKPIGALNVERLASFKQRYNEIPDGQLKFLYGTHYSTPGYVLYYLVRIAPEYMLRLQNGKFDSPDRLFTSIAETWTNVLLNPADLKELIPEFFIGDGEFLENSDNLDLGTRQDGSRVGNVILPPWAKDARDFVRKNREALESEYVSENLHHWIDLIFGYKQQGEEALKANNLFHPWTYEGAIDITQINDPIKREAILVQINEFGQTPKMIFSSPHPKRFSKSERERMRGTYSSSPQSSPTRGILLVPSTPPRNIDDANNNNNIVNSDIAIEPDLLEIDNLLFSPTLDDIENDNELISQFTTKKINDEDITASLDASVASPKEHTSSLLQNQSNVHVTSPLQESARAPLLNIEQWKDLEFFVPCDSIRLHKETVSALCLSVDGKTLYSVSQDTTLKIYSLEEKKHLRSTPICNLALSSVLITREQKCVVIGSWDNKIYFYSIDYGRVVDSHYAHDDAISCMALCDDVLVSGSWDSTVKVWKCRPAGLEKVPLAAFVENEAEVKCVDINRDASLVVFGNEDGWLLVGDLRQKRLVQQVLAHPGSHVSSVSFTPDGRIISVGHSSRNVKVFTPQATSEIFEAPTTEAPRCLVTNGEKLLIACEEGTVRLFDLLTAQELRCLRAPDKTHHSCIAASQRGEFFATGSETGVVLLWSRKQTS
jgi:factor associated with neutral sphingomyelinase activation